MNAYLIPFQQRQPDAIVDEAAADDEEQSSGSGSSRMLKWRGNWVPEEEAKALRHVFDNLQDHFGHQRPDPRVRFYMSLSRNDEQHKDLSFTYTIDGQSCNLPYIGIDICIDLTPKLVHKHGQPMMKDYGKTWVYAYTPDMTMDKIKSYVKAGTGLNVSNDGVDYDPNRNLVAIKAKVHHQSGQPMPSFWVLQEDTQLLSMRENSVSFSRIGSVQEVYDEQPSQQGIHRCVGMFAVSVEVGNTPNPSIKPNSAAGRGEARLSFTLVSVRSWGVTDCVAPIVHSPMQLQWK